MTESDFQSRVIETLGEIKQDQTELFTKLERCIKDTALNAQKIASVELELGGDREYDGLRTKVSKLQSALARNAWYWSTAVGGLITAALSYVVSLFTGSNNN